MLQKKHRESQSGNRCSDRNPSARAVTAVPTVGRSETHSTGDTDAEGGGNVQ